MASTIRSSATNTTAGTNLSGSIPSNRHLDFWGSGTTSPKKRRASSKSRKKTPDSGGSVSASAATSTPNSEATSNIPSANVENVLSQAKARLTVETTKAKETVGPVEKEVPQKRNRLFMQRHPRPERCSDIREETPRALAAMETPRKSMLDSASGGDAQRTKGSDGVSFQTRDEEGKENSKHGTDSSKLPSSRGSVEGKGTATGNTTQSSSAKVNKTDVTFAMQEAGSVKLRSETTHPFSSTKDGALTTEISTAMTVPPPASFERFPAVPVEVWQALKRKDTEYLAHLELDIEEHVAECDKKERKSERLAAELNCLASLAMFRGKIKDALGLAQRAKGIWHLLNKPWKEAETYHQIALIHIEEKAYNCAETKLRYAMKAIDGMESKGFHDEEIFRMREREKQLQREADRARLGIVGTARSSQSLQGITDKSKSVDGTASIEENEGAKRGSTPSMSEMKQRRLEIQAELAVVYGKLKRRGEAEKVFARVLNEAEKMNRWDLAISCYENLGTMASAANDLDKARDWQSKAVDACLRTYGMESPEVANSKMRMGAILKRMGKYTEALAQVKDSLAIRANTSGGAVSEMEALDMKEFADLQRLLGNTRKAASVGKVAVKMAASAFGEKSLEMAQASLVHAKVLIDECLYDGADEALALARESLKGRSREHRSELVGCITLMAKVASSRGRTKEAEKLYMQCVEIVDKELSGDYRGHNLAAVHSNLAAHLFNTGQYDRAREHYEECVTLASGRRQGSVEAALYSSALAKTMGKLGDVYSAVQTMENAYDILSTRLGPKSRWSERIRDDLEIMRNVPTGGAGGDNTLATGYSSVFRSSNQSSTMAPSGGYRTVSCGAPTMESTLQRTGNRSTHNTLRTSSVGHTPRSNNSLPYTSAASGGLARSTATGSGLRRPSTAQGLRRAPYDPNAPHVVQEFVRRINPVERLQRPSAST